MVVATYEQTQVEIVDVFRTGGIIMAVVHALDGSEPFVGGDKWPVRTDWANIPVAMLGNIQTITAPENDYLPDNYL